MIPAALIAVATLGASILASQGTHPDFDNVQLAGPGSNPMIGPEVAACLAPGLYRLESPHGSVRYVVVEGMTAIAALQVVTSDGRRAQIANVFVATPFRRMRIATGLFELASRDFEEIVHSSDLTEEGKAWKNSLDRSF